MRKMPNINLTEEEFRKLYLSDLFNYGSESHIIKSPYNTLYKLFSKGYDITVYKGSHDNEKYLDNKLQKIKLIYDLSDKLQDEFGPYNVPLLSTISVGGLLVWLEMPVDEYDQTLDETYLASYDEKLYVLKRIHKILKCYENYGIIYGDVSADNILVNSNSYLSKFCDIDNIQIGNYRMDTEHYLLSEYISGRGSFDISAQAYMYNLVTLHTLIPQLGDREKTVDFLFSGEIYEYLDRYDEFKKDAVTDIVDSMRKPANFNGEYIIQYIKK